MLPFRPPGERVSFFSWIVPDSLGIAGYMARAMPMVDRFASAERVARGVAVPKGESIALVDKLFDMDFKSAILLNGLQEILGVKPNQAVLMYFLDDGTASVEGFCLCGPGLNTASPGFECFERLVDEMGLQFDGLEEPDKKKLCRVIAQRLGRVHKQLFLVFEKQSAPEAAEDTPMELSTQASLQNKELNAYGENFGMDSIPNLKVMGGIARGLSLQLFTMAHLKDCMPQAEYKFMEKDESFRVNNSGGLERKERKGPQVRNPVDFLVMLRRYCNGLTICALNLPASKDEWGGDSDLGIVRGVRYHWCKNATEWYVGMWSARAMAYADCIHLLLSSEVGVRKEAFRVFHDRRVQLHSAFEQAWARRELHKPIPKNPHNPNLGKGHGNQISGGKRGRLGNDDREGDTPSWKRAGITTAPASLVVNGKSFCKFWADGRGCYRGEACGKHHKCDVMVPGENGAMVPCMGDHKRADHPA